MKVAFDASALDGFADQSRANQLARVVECIQEGALEFFATDEVIAEILGMAASESAAAKLPGHARLILRLTRGNFLPTTDERVLAELDGRPFRLLDSDEGIRMRGRVLEQAAAGRAEETGRRIKSDTDSFKAKHLRFIVPMRSNVRRRHRTDLQPRTDITFNQVHEGHWTKRGAALVTAVLLCSHDNKMAAVMRFLAGYPILRVVPRRIGGLLYGRRAKRVVVQSDRYPYTRLYDKILSVPLYRNLAHDRRPDRGDINDLKQLIHLRDLDVYISDDKLHHEAIGLLFEPPKRVMGSQEFLSATWC